MNSINSCRSKLHTGFPSDHYLMVTEVQVKLASRPTRKPRTPELDFSKGDPRTQARFQSHPESLPRDYTTPDPELSRYLSRPHRRVRHLHTDGSGTKGNVAQALQPARDGVLREKMVHGTMPGGLLSQTLTTPPT